MPEPIKGLGAVQPHVKTAAEEIAARFGVYRIGGFATSGHVANSDHYKGLALDVMTVEKAPMVAEWTIANAKRLSVTYVIWNRRIYDFRKANPQWKKYSGSSPHTDHVHISFAATPGDDNAPVDNVSGASPSDADGCMTLLKSLAGM